jgi:hypothetical protein
MIINNINSIDFLRKNTINGNLTENDIVMFWTGISDYMNGNVEEVNTVNNSILQLLDSTAKKSQDAMNRLSILSSGLADLYAVSGKSNTSFSLFDSDIKSSSESISIDRNLFTISLKNMNLDSYTPQDIKMLPKNATLGNSIEYDIVKYSDINNIIGTHSRLEIENIGSDMVCSLLIDLGEEKPVNNVSFNMINLDARLPKIDSLELSSDGFSFRPQSIVISNQNSIELDNFNFPNDRVSLDIREARTRFIRVNLSQRYGYKVGNISRYAVALNNLSVSFRSSNTNGSIVIGPLRSTSPILKASIEAEVQRLSIEDDNVRFSLSNDNVNWYEVENSKVFNPESSRPKVINFNTKDNSSIATEDPVKDIFLKIDMDSIDASYLSDNKAKISRFRDLITSSDREIFTGQESGETDVFRVLGITYGSKTTFSPGSSVKNSTLISDIRSGTKLMARGVGIQTDNIVDISNDTVLIDGQDSITINVKDDMVKVLIDDNINGVMSNDFDPYKVKTFGLSKPLRTTVKINTVDGYGKIPGAVPVIPIEDSNGLYFLHIGDKIIEIDLSRGYFNSNSEIILVVDEAIDAIEVYNEIGELHSRVDTVTVEDHKVLMLSDVFTLSLPEIQGLNYSESYPLKPLLANEYAIEFGKIIFGRYYKGDAIIDRVVKNDIANTPIKNIDGTSKLMLSTNKQIKARYALDDYDLSKVAKLKHANMINGTVKFDISRASINSFIKEVPFVDGIVEFQLSDRFSQTNNYSRNVINLNSNFLDDGEIVFSGSTSTFTNRVYSEDELIDEGDWMIVYDSVPKILLPEGIYTSDIIDVEVTYNIEANTISTGGLYSIDYRRGIIHTAAPIDHRTIIMYQYSSVFANYEGLTRVPDSEISIGSGSISVDSETEDSEYLAVIKSTTEEDKQYDISPTITDIKINTITEEDFI